MAASENPGKIRAPEAQWRHTDVRNLTFLSPASPRNGRLGRQGVLGHLWPVCGAQPGAIRSHARACAPCCPRTLHPPWSPPSRCVWPPSVQPLSAVSPCACASHAVHHMALELAHERVGFLIICLDYAIAHKSNRQSSPCHSWVHLPFCRFRITVDSEILKQVSTEFFTQWWSPMTSRSWSIWGHLST